MTDNPESSRGVGENPERTIDRTELRDFIAVEGLRIVLLAASKLREVGSEHPLEYIDAPRHAYNLQRLSAFLEADLAEAGYPADSVARIARSNVPAPQHDPTKPRTNL
jgi:hypothetical protein